MSHESIRRLIALFLLVLLAVVALRSEAKEIAFRVAPIAALLLAAMRFYFPRR